jgi:hypothetical protein
MQQPMEWQLGKEFKQQLKEEHAVVDQKINQSGAYNNQPTQ